MRIVESKPGDGSAAGEPFTEAFLSRMEAPLFVVTTSDDRDQPSGCLVGFGTQCSMEPERFLVCISSVNHTYSALERSSRLAVHLLGEHQIQLASLFGERSGDTVSKFDECRWHRGDTGAPILDDCAAWIEGWITDRFDTGDHQTVVFRPCAGGAGPHREILTSREAPEFRAAHPIPD